MIDSIRQSIYNKNASKGAESEQQTRRRLSPSSRKGVMLMRLTFHLGKFTVTIIIRKTQSKKNSRHSTK